MTLTINLNENNLMGMITELEAKGCYEVAKAIEDAYAHTEAIKTIRQIKADYKKEWTGGYYFKHSNGNVTALYFNYANRTYTNEPIYIQGKLMGKPRTLSEVNDVYNTLKEKGFQEV